MQLLNKAEGVKHDFGKPRVDLVPPELVLGAARALTHGLTKYEAQNWRKGLPLSSVYAALQRHLLAFWSGEDLCPKSCLSHLDHAAADLGMLIELLQIYPELDDRPNYKTGVLVQ